MAAAAPRPVTPLGILAARLDGVRARVDALDGADAALRAELEALVELAGGLEGYVGRCTSPESPALRALAQRTAGVDWDGTQAPDGAPRLEQEMLSGHVEGQALGFLVRLTRARRVLDVGMFTGYSALAMAEALGEGGEVVACELVPAVAAIASEAFAATPAGRRIDVRVGPALVTLQELAAAGEAFDLVFVDADKAGYGDYVDAVLGSSLLAEGGLICVDNTLMQGQPWTSGERSANGEAIAAFNERLAADDRVEQVLLALRDGLTLVRRA